MRVLVVDQDSALLTAITQSLGEYFDIDAVTTKADCLDLLRASEFKVIVAGERLEDGSGLELLGQLCKHRPGMLRIFAAERERLKLLKGRLGPFGLFRTLSYPIETRQLLAALSAAGAPEEDTEDMTNIRHVVLEGDGAEEPPPAASPVRPAAPTPRASAAAQPIAPTRRGSAAPSIVYTQPAPAPSGRSRSNTNGATPPSRQAPQQPARTPTRKVRSAQSRRVCESGATVPTQAAAAISAAPRSSAPQRSGRIPGVSGSRLHAAAGPSTDSLSEASRMAATARSRQAQRTGNTGTGRSAFLVGAGVVVVFGVMGIAFKLFNANDESPTTTPGVSIVPNPHFSPEVIKLVAETERAFQQDDFKRARANVQTLQRIAPTHPRLSFFETLLRRRADGSSEPPVVTAAPPEKAPQRRAATPTSAAPRREPAHARKPTPLSANPRAAGGPAFTPPEAPVTTATAAPAWTSPTSFPGKTLEDSNSGAVSPQRVAPSQAMAIPVARSGASPSVTQDARLIKHVSAEYPPSAASRGMEGVVDVSFTVSKDGSVSDAMVVHADPPDVFNRSAIAAVRRWKYEPKTVNGVPVEAHVQLRLQFKLDQHEP